MSQATSARRFTQKSRNNATPDGSTFAGGVRPTQGERARLRSWSARRTMASFRPSPSASLGRAGPVSWPINGSVIMSDRVMESIPLIGSLVQAGAGVAGVVLSALGLRKRDPARRSPSTDDASTVFGDQARGNIVAGDYASVATRGGVAAARDVNIYGTPTHTSTLARIHRRTPMDGVRAAEGGG